MRIEALAVKSDLIVLAIAVLLYIELISTDIYQACCKTDVVCTGYFFRNVLIGVRF